MKNRPGEVLDAGCGIGQHITVLNRYKHVAEGIGKSKAMIKRARKKQS